MLNRDAVDGILLSRGKIGFEMCRFEYYTTGTRKMQDGTKKMSISLPGRLHSCFFVVTYGI